MMEVVVEGPEMMLIEKIKRAREKDEKVARVIEKIKKARVRNLRDKE